MNEAFLEVVYSPEPSTSNHAIDVVAVHGFGAHPYWTWTREQKHMLKDSDMLPQFFPGARILVFGYHSENPTAKTVDRQIAVLAVELLRLLCNMRTGDDKRPLVFIGHSFGGNIIEKALVDCAKEDCADQELLLSIAGVIFLGTPHRPPIPRPRTLVLPALLSVLGHAGSSLLLRLRNGPGISEQVFSQFKELAQRYSVPFFCFYELETSNLGLILRSQGLPVPPYYLSLAMADPLSVAASIAGLISITVEAAKYLRPYISAAKDTPQVAAHVYSEVQSTQVILSGLQELTNNLGSVQARHAGLIGVNQVVTILTDGVLLFSELHDELRSLSPKDDVERIPLRTRLQWARKEGTFATLLTRLQGFKSSMTLVLMILKSDSDRSATQHQEQLSANINLLLESNHSLSRRLMNLEDALDSQTIASKRMSFLSLSGTTPQRSESQRSQPSTVDTESTIAVSKFDFEDDLELSRVYRRAQRDTMDFSFRSSIARSNSWSVFSGLSLGDVSIMSVIALPVYQEDLTNAQHYDFGDNTTLIAEAPQPSTEEPLLVECLEIMHKMLQLPGMEEHFRKHFYPDDIFNMLWAVLRRGIPLIIILQALDPRIDFGADSTTYFSKTLTGYTRDIQFFESKEAIAWFVQYCHDVLEIETSSLFTVADLMGESSYGFSKVTFIVSLLIEKLTVAGIVSDKEPSESFRGIMIRSDSPALVEFLSDQRHLVRQLAELANIKTLLEVDVLSRDDVIDVFGRIEDLADFHITFLVKMERNFLVPPIGHGWLYAFQFYLEHIETEAVFIANERLARTKIRSWLDHERFKGDDRSINLLTKCLKILPLPAQRLPKYNSFIEYLYCQPTMSDDQRQDVIMAKSNLQNATAKIDEALKYEENQDAVKDLKRRIEDWKGHQINGFGHLVLYDSFNVTKNNVTKPYRGYLFQNILLVCKEVKPGPAPRSGFFFKKNKPATTVQQTKLQLKGRIFLTNITDVLTSSNYEQEEEQAFMALDGGKKSHIAEG
ncbi:hypothetical protein FSARC_5507 [Fusarium sarcochroum]|uniref:DH domain-containing protein n=1 Tax=Fusarium sarcochroum TaxID=1208366 RepID=A0A8H4TZQ8_9HYPO|nr:hypothetical protein FSARC_5507 [Fusarium sarcochroum]